MNSLKTTRLDLELAPNDFSDANSSRRSGRVSFDSRGNAVWEWQTETGDYSTDANTQRLRKISAPELTLEDTTRSNRLAPRAGEAMIGGGFDPYDRGAQGLGFKPPVRSIQSKFGSKPKSAEDLRRLGEWMKMKQRIAAQKDE